MSEPQWKFLVSRLVALHMLSELRVFLRRGQIDSECFQIHAYTRARITFTWASIDNGMAGCSMITTSPNCVLVESNVLIASSNANATTGKQRAAGRQEGEVGVSSLPAT